MFRGEGGNWSERNRRPAVEGVADCKHPGVSEPDDVARIGPFERLALVGKKAHRARQPHILAGPGVAHRHIPLEFPRAHAHERDPIAMAGVHVRLNFEDKTAEFRIGWGDAGARGWPRRQLDERIQEELHAEVRHRASKEYRGDGAA
jgi:hypothetical protein